MSTKELLYKSIETLHKAKERKIHRVKEAIDQADKDRQAQAAEPSRNP